MTDYSILARPRIRQATFERILVEAGSPAAPEAAAAWKGIVRHGVDPAFALAIFKLESGYGRKGPTVSRRNWGGLSASESYPDDGRFAVYPTWAEGARDTARLLVKYGRNAIQVGRRTDTARTFAFVYASADDQDALRRYGEQVAASIGLSIRRDWEWSRGGSDERSTLLASPRAVGQDAAGAYAAAFRASRIRIGPHVGAAITHTLPAGAAIVADRAVDGGPYATEGKRSNRWLRVVEVDGVPLAAPMFTAAVLWRRAATRPTGTD